MLSSMPDYINDLREVQHFYLLKQAEQSHDDAVRMALSPNVGDNIVQRLVGVATGYYNAANRVSELLETWEKQHADQNHPR